MSCLLFRPSPQLWLGGSPNQTRLAKVFAELVKLSLSV
jgi:hypothetical protein